MARVVDHPRVVMETLGHSQIGITMDTYAHVYAGALHALAETMDRMLPSMDPSGTGDIEPLITTSDAQERR